MSLKRTPLHAAHLSLGARMVDFGGWDMPLSYSSQIEEHHAVRRSAGMFDVSHMCPVDLRGDVRPLLRRLLANDIDKAELSGKALYSCMLNAAGGVIDDLIVYYLGESWFRVVVNASTADKDLEHIQQVIAQSGFDVEVTPRRDLAIIAAQGPQARERFWQAVPAARLLTEPVAPFFCAVAADLMVARTGYTGEDGFEIMLPGADAGDLWQALLDAGVAPAGLGARDTLRLEAGMNLYGNDMDERTSPLDAGLGWTVDLKHARNFIGREALASAGQRHEFLGLRLLERGVMRSHQRVVTRAGDGEITSGTHSPSVGASIAMARLPIGIRAGEAVGVDIRGKLMSAQVVRLPFVRRGKVLI
ncbi:glycine cleavage system aminomethyltransferase GcvT [soil metagenome]